MKRTQEIELNGGIGGLKWPTSNKRESKVEEELDKNCNVQVLIFLNYIKFHFIFQVINSIFY